MEVGSRDVVDRTIVSIDDAHMKLDQVGVDLDLVAFLYLVGWGWRRGRFEFGYRRRLTKCRRGSGRSLSLWRWTGAGCWLIRRSGVSRSILTLHRRTKHKGTNSQYAYQEHCRSSHVHPSNQPTLLLNRHRQQFIGSPSHAHETLLGPGIGTGASFEYFHADQRAMLGQPASQLNMRLDAHVNRCKGANSALPGLRTRNQRAPDVA